MASSFSSQQSEQEEEVLEETLSREQKLEILKKLLGEISTLSITEAERQIAATREKEAEIEIQKEMRRQKEADAKIAAATAEQSAIEVYMELARRCNGSSEYGQVICDALNFREKQKTAREKERTKQEVQRTKQLALEKILPEKLKTLWSGCFMKARKLNN